MNFNRDRLFIEEIQNKICYNQLKWKWKKIKIFSKEEKIAIFLIGLFGFSLPIIFNFGILTPIFWAFFLIIYIIILFIIAFNRERKKSINIFEKFLNDLEDFTATKKLIDSFGLELLAIDENRKKICFVYARNTAKLHAQPKLDKNKSKNMKVFIKVYSYKDIISSEILQDEVTVTKTDRINQLGGVLLGGLVLGKTGAVIGGLSGKKTSTQSINKIDLLITVNDSENPIHKINIANSWGGMKPVSYLDYEKALYWHNLISVLIKQAEQEDNISNNKNTSQNIIDDLNKLIELKNKGILTDEEFQKLKEHIIKAI